MNPLPLADVIDAHRYFFVRGYSRSGTNWVTRLLNLHPQVRCTGEFHLYHLHRQFLDLAHSPYSNLSRDEVRSSAEPYFEAMVKAALLSSAGLAGSGCTWCGEHSPVPVFPTLTRAAANFLVVRDPRDVIVSWTYHLLRLKIASYDDASDPHNELFGRFPFLKRHRELFRKDSTYFEAHPRDLIPDPAWAAYQADNWARFLQIDLEVLADFEQVPDDVSVFLVRYERLHRDVEGERRRMYRFLGLDPEAAGPLGDQERAGFSVTDTLSHNRKGLVGDWTTYLSDEIRDCIDAVVGEKIALLDRFPPDGIFAKARHDAGP